MSLHGFTSITPTEVLIGPAVLYRAGVAWAVSRGGIRVEPFREIREVEFDGRRAPVNGLDRVVAHGLRITGTWLEWGIAQAQRHEFGVTGVLVTQTTTITPRVADTLFPSGAYVTDILCVVKRADNTLVGVRVPKMLVTYAIGGEDKSEAGIDTVFEARVDVSSFDVEDSPYTIEFDTSGVVEPPEDDPWLELVEDLGGDVNVAAMYVVTDGVTGLKSDSVVVNAGVVDEWQDYRGTSGYGPTITFAGTAKPAWNTTDLTIVSDGTDDNGSTIASSVFALNQAKAFVIVGSHVSGTYIATINDGTGVTRAMALYKDPTNWAGHLVTPPYPGANSGVAADATRRVVIFSKDSGTGMKIAVPNQAQVTTPSANNPSDAGNNVLTMFRAFPGGGPAPSSVVVKAVFVLNIDPDSTQRNFIRDATVTHLAAVTA